jgi:DUF971 family protein
MKNTVPVLRMMSPSADVVAERYGERRLLYGLAALVKDSVGVFSTVTAAVSVHAMSFLQSSC